MMVDEVEFMEEGGKARSTRIRRGSDMAADENRLGWLDDAACADLAIEDFFVEAGHAISDNTLNVCRRCPVRESCLEHAYEMNISGGYFGGMSPGQRRQLTLDRARVFIETDLPRGVDGRRVDAGG